MHETLVIFRSFPREAVQAIFGRHAELAITPKNT